MGFFICTYYLYLAVPQPFSTSFLVTKLQSQFVWCFKPFVGQEHCLYEQGAGEGYVLAQTLLWPPRYKKEWI